MRALLALPLVLALVSAAPPPRISDQAARLKAANAAAAAAEARSRRLESAAAAELDAATKARAQEAAVAARIQASEAQITAAATRVAMTARLLDAQRARLAERQQPILRLIAALQSFARRPAVVAVVQPGSIADAVHVRATLGTILPVIARRSAEVRVEIARTARLQADATLASRTLADSRARLQSERLALVRMEGEHRLRGQQLGRGALFESDRAIAMGERARDIVDQMASMGDQAATREELGSLPGPLPRPARPDRSSVPGDLPQRRFAQPPYRLPVAGAVVSGFGEMAPTGVRSRGLTLSTWAGAQIVAPAPGRIVFARPFRGYGNLVIIDHGHGWTTAIAGLGGIAVRVGTDVMQGTPIGRAADGDASQLTVELRRQGRPVDIAALL